MSPGGSGSLWEVLGFFPFFSGLGYSSPKGLRTYRNITVYATGSEKIDGTRDREANALVGGISDEILPGTATGYLPAGDPDADLMYAYKVSRRCARREANCLPLSAPCPRLTLDSSTVLDLYFRIYLEPTTKAGASMSEILYDRVIRFSPRP